jgi:hypothetical protein
MFTYHEARLIGCLMFVCAVIIFIYINLKG